MDIINYVRNCHQAIRIEKQVSKMITQEDDAYIINLLTKRRLHWVKEANTYKKWALDQIGLDQFQNIQRALLKGEL